MMMPPAAIRTVLYPQAPTAGARACAESATLIPAMAADWSHAGAKRGRSVGGERENGRRRNPYCAKREGRVLR